MTALPSTSAIHHSESPVTQPKLSHPDSDWNDLQLHLEQEEIKKREKALKAADAQRKAAARTKGTK